MGFFDKQKAQQTIYGAPALGQRPWWARPFAFAKTPLILGYVASALLLYSVWYGFCKVDCRNFELPGAVQTDPCKVETTAKAATTSLANEEKRLTSVGFQKALLIFVWVLVPPIWFWLEYFGIWRYENKTARQDLEELKYGQELAAKIWLAAITALGILYFGKDIKGGS
jgi:hypothetical protein